VAASTSGKYGRQARAWLLVLLQRFTHLHVRLSASHAVLFCAALHSCLYVTGAPGLSPQVEGSGGGGGTGGGGAGWQLASHASRLVPGVPHPTVAQVSRPCVSTQA
jgi:hypothetical protein